MESCSYALSCRGVGQSVSNCWAGQNFFWIQGDQCNPSIICLFHGSYRCQLLWVPFRMAGLFPLYAADWLRSTLDSSNTNRSYYDTLAVFFSDKHNSVTLYISGPCLQSSSRCAFVASAVPCNNVSCLEEPGTGHGKSTWSPLDSIL